MSREQDNLSAAYIPFWILTGCFCDSPLPFVRLLGGSPLSSSLANVSILRLKFVDIEVLYPVSAVTGGFFSDSLSETRMAASEANKR